MQAGIHQLGIRGLKSKKAYPAFYVHLRHMRQRLPLSRFSTGCELTGAQNPCPGSMLPCCMMPQPVSRHCGWPLFHTCWLRASWLCLSMNGLTVCKDESRMAVAPSCKHAFHGCCLATRTSLRRCLAGRRPPFRMLPQLFVKVRILSLTSSLQASAGAVPGGANALAIPGKASSPKKQV